MIIIFTSAITITSSKIRGLIIHELSVGSLDLSLSREEREQKRKQATVRATFMQDLLLSTLFED